LSVRQNDSNDETYLGAEPYLIGLAGSSAFAGWTVACLIIPRLGDLYGRKWPVSISLLIATVTHILIVMSENWSWTVFLFFIFGGCCAGRYSTAFVYMTELLPKKDQDIFGSLVQCLDAGTFIIIPLYFRFISKEWLPLQLFVIACALVSQVALLFIPESPKYLYSKGKFL